MHINNAQGAYLYLRDRDWRAMLDLARNHGWKPAGTLPPPLDFNLTGMQSSLGPWTGSYTPPRGQTVKSEDAKGLAAVLESLAGQTIGGESEPRPTSFIAFCRKGGFLICATPAGFEAPPSPEFRTEILARGFRHAQTVEQNAKLHV
jgi:hypothetical protein